MKEIELYRLSTGEKIVHVPETRSIVVRFNAPKKVLSTSLEWRIQRRYQGAFQLYLLRARFLHEP